MICGMGFVSEHMAFTSRMIFIAVLSNCRVNRMASSAVLIKFVSDGARGSKQRVIARSSARRIESRNVSVAHCHAWLALTPAKTFRCLGEPMTIIFPPRSAQKSTNSQKYLAVRVRTSASG